MTLLELYGHPGAYYDYAHRARPSPAAVARRQRQRLQAARKNEAFASLDAAEQSLESALREGDVAGVRCAARDVSLSASSLERFGRTDSVLQATEEAREILDAVPAAEEIRGRAQVARVLSEAAPQLERIDAFAAKAEAAASLLKELRKEYVAVNELLTRSMTALDGVEVSGPSSDERTARARRKEGIAAIDGKLGDMEGAASRLEALLRSGGGRFFAQGAAAL